MSIEKIITDNTEAGVALTNASLALTRALENLTALLGTLQAPIASQVTVDQPKLNAREAEEALFDQHSKKAEAKPEPKAEAKPEPKAEAKPEPKAEAKHEPVADEDALEYDTVRALVLNLAPLNRQGVKDTLAAHGIRNLKELLADEKDTSSVTDAAKLARIYADLQALGE